MLFGATLLTAIGALAVDYVTSEAPQPRMAQDESFNPCAAALVTKPGGRNYDDLADDYSGSVAPLPEPVAPPSGDNPCSAGIL